MLRQDLFHDVIFGKICKNASTRVNDPKNSDYERYVGLEHLDTLEPKILRFGSTQNVKSSMTLFSKKQILFGRRNWYLRRVAVADFDGICSADIYVLEAKGSQILPDFLPLFMHSNQFFDETMKYSSGSMSTRVKWSDLEKIKFTIPLISEQKKIIKIISAIDESITKTQNLLDKLKTYKESKAHDLLTKGIGHTKFKKVKSFFDTYDEIPREWNVTNLSDVCDTRESAQIKSDLYVGLEHISQDTNQLIAKGNLKKFTSNKNSFYKNDVLYGKLRPRLNKVWLANEEGYCSTDILPLCTKEKIIPQILLSILTDYRFFWYAISTSAGTKMPRTNWTDMKKFTVFLPPLKEQQKIALILTQLEEQYRQLENHLALLKKMRKSMINKKLTPPTLRKKIVQ